MPKHVHDHQVIELLQSCLDEPVYRLGKMLVDAGLYASQNGAEGRVRRMFTAGILKRPSRITSEPLPPKGLTTEELIQHKVKKATQRRKHFAAKKWRPIKIDDPQPVCVALVGDPHIDSPDCDWDVLLRDIELMKRPGVVAINVGDTLDNWPVGGRLARLLVHSDTSQEEAHQLAKWFMLESGVDWLLWLLGNHDAMRDSLSLLSHEWGGERVWVEDWGAQFQIEHADRSYRVWAAHDFPGHSMWNPLHGHRRAFDKVKADLYIAGHKHNWAVTNFEDEHQNTDHWFVRARGYKAIHDSHAEKLGFGNQTRGHTLGWVLDPSDEGPGYVFKSLEQAVRYMEYLRA